LAKDQGPFRPKPRLPVLDELVLTVLSQHTSDANSGRAFASLKARFASWEEVVHAPAIVVADAIRAGGIANIKAQRIQAILAEIEEREGGFETKRIERLSDAAADAYFRSLPGVGPKTAACVLAFSMRRPAFPVDTHVHRVSVRLGLIGRRATAEQAQEALASRIPAELRYEFHVQLVRHGRTVCKPRRPRCTDCALIDLCDAGPRLLAGGLAL
jgi:endonuclease-3